MRKAPQESSWGSKMVIKLLLIASKTTEVCCSEHKGPLFKEIQKLKSQDEEEGTGVSTRDGFNQRNIWIVGTKRRNESVGVEKEEEEEEEGDGGGGKKEEEDGDDGGGIFEIDGMEEEEDG
uniref:Uncharacterized protein n=1 Tax=Caenorhabditis brenneri TaxID=135651 RepID=B6VBC0_CAEBE|nr:hypothetical protein Cbre_JD03.002 [Caenorhabditis brenneri]